ncbi:MAG: hypothetical protein ACTSVZ_03730 [Promethearchaeota archaeon]
MNQKQIEIGIGRNVYKFANQIRIGLIISLIVVAGWIAVSLAAANMR